MTRRDAYNLHHAIFKIKSGALPVGTMVKYIELREKLSSFIEEFNSAKKEMSLQTKPEDWKEGDNSEEWDNSFILLVDEYLKGEVGINPQILSKEEAVQFYVANQDIPGDQLDYIKLMLTIKEDSK